MSAGLVLGKFAPLHKGHQWLIEQAHARVDRLYVLVYESPEITDAPGLTTRAGWVRRLYPDARVLEGWGAPSSQGRDPAIMREQEDYLRGLMPEPITHFFSSEWYGAHVATALGAEDVRVDMARERFPVSATRVRENVRACREFLDPLVHRDLIPKVVLLGAESTGKTTLAARLAADHGTLWMPEHGRDYWLRHQDAHGRLSPAQLVELAQEHRALEDALALEADRWLFVDTNALTTAAFCRWYHGFVPDELEALAAAAATRYRHTFLCADDIPYVEDGTRNGAGHRADFQRWIVADLAARAIPYHTLRGPLPAREAEVARVLAAASRFLPERRAPAPSPFLFSTDTPMTTMTDTPLLTDLYQLTMAAGYWKSGLAEREAVFHLSFRSLPFHGGYAVAAGLGDAARWLGAFRFTDDDLAYLATLLGRDGKPLFERGFLDYLATLAWTCDVDAIPEGTVVFAHEPLVRVRGPLLQAQLAETALLTIVNFQTLIATKAARVCEAAQGDLVMEFGLRRAQGPDGGVSASRAAFIGGCGATSNVLAGKQFGIPVKGTHAHSWVMAFASELEAFAAYSDAMPNNCVLLVDTYDTLEGVRHAAEIGRRLRARGHDLAGIRLDSGDLAWLSVEARRILDEAGFPDAAIVASNDLDEHLVESLKHQGAAITVWGVGTKLVTGGDQAALGGVYKLGAIRDEAGHWQPKLKLSEQSAKVSNPGLLQVRRFVKDGHFIGDAIYDEAAPLPETWRVVHPADPVRTKDIPRDAVGEDLLQPVYRRGVRTAAAPTLDALQQRCREQRAALHPAIKRLSHPHAYPAGLEQSLANRKARMIEEAKHHGRA